MTAMVRRRVEVPKPQSPEVGLDQSHGHLSAIIDTFIFSLRTTLEFFPGAEQIARVYNVISLITSQASKEPNLTTRAATIVEIAKELKLSIDNSGGPESFVKLLELYFKSLQQVEQDTLRRWGLLDILPNSLKYRFLSIALLLGIVTSSSGGVMARDASKDASQSAGQPVLVEDDKALAETGSNNSIPTDPYFGLVASQIGLSATQLRETFETLSGLLELFENPEFIDFLATANSNPEQVVAGPEDAIDPQPTIDTVSLTGQTYTVGVASLNARSGPGTENSILGAVTNGQSFEILNESNGTNYTWYQIRLGDELVWIADVNNSGIVSESEPIQTEVYKLVTQVTTISASEGSPVRPSNSSNSGFIDFLPAGAEVEVVGVEAGDTIPPTWIQVTYTTSSGQEVSGFVTDHVLDLQKVDLEAWEANEQPTQFVPESPPTTFPTPEATGDTQNPEPVATFTPETRVVQLNSTPDNQVVSVEGADFIDLPVILLVSNGVVEPDLGNVVSGLSAETQNLIRGVLDQAAQAGQVVLASIDSNNQVSAIFTMTRLSGNPTEVEKVLIISPNSPDNVNLANAGFDTAQILIAAGETVIEFNKLSAINSLVHIVNRAADYMVGYQNLGLGEQIQSLLQDFEQGTPMIVYGFGNIIDRNNLLPSDFDLTTELLPAIMLPNEAGGRDILLYIDGKLFKFETTSNGIEIIEEMSSGGGEEEVSREIEGFDLQIDGAVRVYMAEGGIPQDRNRPNVNSIRTSDFPSINNIQPALIEQDDPQLQTFLDHYNHNGTIHSSIETFDGGDSLHNGYLEFFRFLYNHQNGANLTVEEVISNPSLEISTSFGRIVASETLEVVIHDKRFLNIGMSVSNISSEVTPEGGLRINIYTSRLASDTLVGSIVSELTDVISDETGLSKNQLGGNYFSPIISSMVRLYELDSGEIQLAMPVILGYTSGEEYIWIS